MIKDVKHLREELLLRDRDDYRDGWGKPGHHWIIGCLWGVILVELILIGVGK